MPNGAAWALVVGRPAEQHLHGHGHMDTAHSSSSRPAPSIRRDRPRRESYSTRTVRAVPYSAFDLGYEYEYRMGASI